MAEHPIAVISALALAAGVCVSSILAQVPQAAAHEWQALAVLGGVASGTAIAVGLVWRIVRGSLKIAGDTLDELQEENKRLRELLAKQDSQN
jgi:flagellar biosynthesis protein FliR